MYAEVLALPLPLDEDWDAPRTTRATFLFLTLLVSTVDERVHKQNSISSSSILRLLRLRYQEELADIALRAPPCITADEEHVLVMASEMYSLFPFAYEEGTSPKFDDQAGEEELHRRNHQRLVSFGVQPERILSRAAKFASVFTKLKDIGGQAEDREAIVSIKVADFIEDLFAFVAAQLGDASGPHRLLFAWLQPSAPVAQ
jgi:hypothetical protein